MAQYLKTNDASRDRQIPDQNLQEGELALIVWKWPIGDYPMDVEVPSSRLRQDLYPTDLVSAMSKHLLALFRNGGIPHLGNATKSL